MAARRRHALSLAGRSFAFHGVLPTRRARLSAAIVAAGGELFSPPSPPAPSPARVFMITDYWTCAPLPAPPAVECVAVTEFWLREMLRTHEWLEPAQHVFFTPPPATTSPPLSYPEDYDESQGSDVASSECSRLRMLTPFAPANTFKQQVPFWPYYVAYLSAPMRDAQELATVLKSITGMDQRRSLNCLELALDRLSASDRELFFTIVLPELARLVLSLPTLFSQHPEVLGPLALDDSSVAPSASASTPRVRAQSVTFTKREALALVAACFFSVFPSQSRLVTRPAGDDVDVDFPHFAMRSLLTSHPKGGDAQVKAEKLRCVLHYFLRVVPLLAADSDRLDSEVLTLTRVAVALPSAAATRPPTSPQQLLDTLSPASFDGSGELLAMSGVRCESERLIEDLDAHLQVDFANKFAGGGVFGAGCVQEEIRFVLSPELLLACLVFAKLEPHEAFVVHGSERFASYSGYGVSFAFQRDFVDCTPCAALVAPDSPQHPPQRRRQCVVVGIDAVDYGGAQVGRQYAPAPIWRDLVKAAAGFAYPDASSARWPVASGNWGCGVFRGDAELKFVIQWLAASLARRELVYVLFERDQELHAGIRALLRVLESGGAEEPELRRRAPLLLAQFLLGLDEALARRAAALRDAGKRGPRPSVLALARDFLDTQLQGLKRLKLTSPPPPGVQVVGDSSSAAVVEPADGNAKANAPPLAPKSPAGGAKGLQQKAITSFFRKH
ncbi:hypothetical protein PybrP1_010639 [[Pythium] brassicae (nom. inval.)]|nr:hypothetical protein PybrP1_010639 [[Pythium] brassicae (nom. inval.)]